MKQATLAGAVIGSGKCLFTKVAGQVMDYEVTALVGPKNQA
ncbi:MAG TPA: hypothetical protein VKV17_20745 [Bryobacteraceae bacterium]|nr:hypothetical protein [Bryobacteraceae bacterium]